MGWTQKTQRFEEGDDFNSNSPPWMEDGGEVGEGGNLVGEYTTLYSKCVYHSLTVVKKMYITSHRKTLFIYCKIFSCKKSDIF